MADAAVSIAAAEASRAAVPSAFSRAVQAVTGRLVIIVPYLWLLFFFLVPFVIVFKISLSQTAIAMPPYTPVFSFEEGLAGLWSQLGELNFDNYLWLTEDRALLQRLCVERLDRGGLDRARADRRLSDRLWHGARAGLAPADAADAGHPAVLDLVPDPRLRLDRHPQAGGPAQPAPAALRHHRQPLIILNTHTAIFIGIVYSYLPFMILPLYSSLEKMDYSLIEAAQDLGCRPISAFWKITFPLSLPGVIAGCMLVFIPAVGEFVIPDLLGGSQTLMIGKTLWNEFFANRDWPVSSAVAVILLLLLIVPIMIFQSCQARAQEQGAKP